MACPFVLLVQFLLIVASVNLVRAETFSYTRLTVVVLLSIFFTTVAIVGVCFCLARLWKPFVDPKSLHSNVIHGYSSAWITAPLWTNSIEEFHPAFGQCENGSWQCPITSTDKSRRKSKSSVKRLKPSASICTDVQSQSQSRKSISGEEYSEVAYTSQRTPDVLLTSDQNSTDVLLQTTDVGSTESTNQTFKTIRPKTSTIVNFLLPASRITNSTKKPKTRTISV